MIKEVAPNLFRIQVPSKLKKIKPEVNLYFFAAEDGILWDAGYGGELSMHVVERDLAAIQKIMAERGQKCRVTRILLSHGHADHFSGLKGLRELTGAKVLLTATQAANVKNRSEYLRAWREPKDAMEPETPFSIFLANLFFRGLQDWLFGVNWMPDPDEIIPESGNLRVGGRILHYFPIPGHADDHIALYSAPEGILLSGDHVLRRITPWIGPPRSDIDEYEASLEHLLALTDLKIILPAHGSSITDPYPHLRAALRHSHARTNKICRLVTRAGHKGISFYGIVMRVYPKSSFLLWLSARGWILLTLRMLIKDGCIGVRREKGRQIFFSAERTQRRESCRIFCAKPQEKED
ncbi:MBL fold metallo-hydrolase [Desulfococcaceae bacterium OttesenSCG-928-F15]|nr:MBL fold metallo-hydrolase [Desulfococcaceae bacterium OttesenSCG-928-F15]